MRAAFVAAGVVALPFPAPLGRTTTTAPTSAGRAGPMHVLVGRDDEVFQAERFPDVFEQAGRPAAVTIVPGVGHVGLTVVPAGIAAIVSSLGDACVAAP